MKILLVEDEEGIRAGLAAFLQLRGHVVRVAGSRAEGLRELEAGEFDAIVTDWRLGDGLGADLVERSAAPAIVMSGFTDEVDVAAVKILAKPVTPPDLLAELETLAAARPEPVVDSLAGLPVDTADRLRLVLALLGEPQAQIVDDGAFVTLRAALTDVDERRVGDLEALGGDLRLLGEPGALTLELRVNRDGRPDGPTARKLAPLDPWPAEDLPIVVDFDGQPCSPAAFLEIIDRTRNAGRSVALLNVPAHLRFYLDVLGRAHDMPKRAMSGPRIPEVLNDLWRSGREHAIR